LSKGEMTVRQIPVELLVPHPENSNFMNAETLGKLRMHIQRTGRYEPLTVRRHPAEAGKFQIINGHNRLRVLRALGFKTINCVVWEVTDDQTRLYLATLNRLSGREVPERRAALIESLVADFNAAELASLLPDHEKQLRELRRISEIDPEPSFTQAPAEEDLGSPTFLSFALDEPKARGVNLALDLIMSGDHEVSSRSEALWRLAQFYLESRTPVAGR